MVSFSCETCCETLKKPKLDQHAQRCWAVFTCLDCNVTFQGTDYRTHTSCISEEQRYHKSVYKAPKGKGQKNQNQNQQQQQQQQQAAPAAAPIAIPTPIAPIAEAVAPKPSTGVNPERQKILDAAGHHAVKRGREEEEEQVVAPSAAAKEVVDTDMEPANKKSKKALKKAAKKAAAASSSSSEIVSTPTTPAESSTESLNTFLSKIVPELLANESRSLKDVKKSLVEKAREAGWKDGGKVVEAFEEGVWVGGAEKKKRLVVKF